MKKILMILSIFIGFSNVFAFTISYFSPSVFNGSNMTATNQALGVSDYMFEDFDDNTLIPGLTITATVNIPNSYMSYPSTRVHQGSSTSGISTSSIASWAGNQKIIYPQVVANIHRFDFAQGISSFGIGIAEIDDIGGPHAIYVNGQDTGLRVESLSGFVRTGGRNLYVRVDAGTGEQITSFALQTTTTNTNDVESLFFSHLAFKEAPDVGVTSVPEANTFFLCMTILFFCVIIKK